MLLAVVVAVSVFWGRYLAAGFTWPGRLADDELTRQLVLTLRIPRVLTAAALGASLAAAGTVFQQIFANPLIEPGFLGVSQGAVFGADTRHLLPAAVLIGALVGVGCDDLARTLLPGEIPIGILTSFIGACFFLVVITRPGPANGPGGTGGTS